MFKYQHLSAEERQHFVEHGWLRIPDAINDKYLDPWIENFWVRLGADKNDKSTWRHEFLKMPRHREVRNEEFCTADAWGKVTELIGGPERLHPYRERYFGDQFITNFGNEYWETHEQTPHEAKGWHIDNDWYRQMLDSGGYALTLIFLFTDCPERGGGTYVCEDALQGVCKYLYDHPEGLDHPYDELVAHVKDCNQFASIVGRKGDLFVTHQLLPHSHSANHLRYARIITNPHVALKDDHNLNRADGDYTLCEQVILRALGRESVPEFQPTRPRIQHYPRTAYFKRARVYEELERLFEDAERKGLGAETVESVYLQGDDAIAEHERRNGYDLGVGPNGVMSSQQENTNDVIGSDVNALKDQAALKVAAWKPALKDVA